MTINWRKGVGILTSIYVSRMLGMFMVFPIFSLYANQLEGATPKMVGLALGVYGLTQGLLQIPFGLLSDYVERKIVIAGGLILFVVGSLIAAMADSIAMMIIGRAIQGMGAISSVTLAYTTDITPEDKLGKVMAIIGGSIGLSFVLSLILGPILAQAFGVRELFFMIALMAASAFIASLFLPRTATPLPTEPSMGQYDKIALWQASGAIFMTHALFTATFVVLPILLQAFLVDKSAQWWIYLPANLLALALMRYKAIPHPLNFGMSFMLLALGLGAMSLLSSFWGVFIAISLFFIAFYRLETGLPHWVANVADPQARGKAMGIYSTSQFFGSFAGGVLGGWLWAHLQNTQNLFMILLLLASIVGFILLTIGRKHALSVH